MEVPTCALSNVAKEVLCTVVVTAVFRRVALKLGTLIT
jgi:hypothetical protein